MSHFTLNREARSLIAMGFMIFILLMIDTPMLAAASGMQ
jgi:hypothetical protein